MGSEMDFIKIDYTGRMKDGGVFDTTCKETAEKEGILNSNRVYKPMTVIVGEKQVIEGLDEALAKMKVGEEREVEIPPEKAYGKRDPARVNLVPAKIFKKEKVNPFPGMPIEIDGMHGRVQTVAGGRVRVDFNHEFAGKTLVFKVKVVEKAEDDNEKAKYLVEKSFEDSNDFSINLAGKKLCVKLSDKAYKDRNLLVRKASLSAEAFKYLKVSEVEFSEVWKNPESVVKKELEKDAGKEKPKKASTKAEDKK
ncbi:MAG TPA: peptidylprolyl isomerase [Candidatus Altiarchaeales archaeon]|nr:peptidylprolyl isomerase [Candidatus Altiarchaeales archaeon]